jgi:hypothetical protein
MGGRPTAQQYHPRRLLPEPPASVERQRCCAAYQMIVELLIHLESRLLWNGPRADNTTWAGGSRTVLKTRARAALAGAVARGALSWHAKRNACPRALLAWRARRDAPQPHNLGHVCTRWRRVLVHPSVLENWTRPLGRVAANKSERLQVPSIVVVLVPVICKMLRHLIWWFRRQPRGKSVSRVRIAFSYDFIIWSQQELDLEITWISIVSSIGSWSQFLT